MTNLTGETLREMGDVAKGRIRVAIADDHAIFRDALCRLLSIESDLCVVAQAEDGSQVSDMIRQHDPDVLLLDLNMPVQGGLAVLKALQSISSRTRVIILTASDNLCEFIEALKLGTCGIVQKQTDTDLLIHGIRRVHSGDLWIDSNTTAAVMRSATPGSTTSVGSSTPPQNRHGSMLSRRQHEIVSLVVRGFKNSEIAAKLSLSEQTVKNNLRIIFDKLRVTDRLELALQATEQISRLRTGTSVSQGQLKAMTGA